MRPCIGTSFLLCSFFTQVLLDHAKHTKTMREYVSNVDPIYEALLPTDKNNEGQTGRVLLGQDFKAVEATNVV